MYTIQYSTTTSSWDVEFNGTICQAISEARVQLKTRYSGFNWIIAEIIESIDDQFYNIGEVSKKGKWRRSTYKMYNCLEDNSTRQSYKSKFKERQQPNLFITKQKRFESKTYEQKKEHLDRAQYARLRGFPLEVRIARKLAKLKVTAVE